MSREEFYASLRKFFHDRNPELDPLQIGADDNLWDKGLVNSFSTFELLMHIQAELKQRIAVNRYAPRTFHTMQRMYDAFVAQQVGQDAP